LPGALFKHLKKRCAQPVKRPTPIQRCREPPSFDRS
jgi:hypothetical protein